jgi:hypothetical protein
LKMRYIMSIIPSIAVLIGSECSSALQCSTSTALFQPLSSCNIMRHRSQIRRLSSPPPMYSSSGYYHHQTSDTSASSLSEDASDEQDVNSRMVWSEWQDWALCDNLPKYLITIPPPDVTMMTTAAADDNDHVAHQRPKTRQYALWRNMLRDVPELSGYNVAFVRHMYSKQRMAKPTTQQPLPSVIIISSSRQFQDGASVRSC